MKPRSANVGVKSRSELVFETNSARSGRRPKRHFVKRIGRLRAAVLGANDGILSTSSLILGVAFAAGSHTSILIAGVLGLSPARCQWPPANTSPSVRGQTASGRILAASVRRSATIRSVRRRSWRPYAR